MTTTREVSCREHPGAIPRVLEELDPDHGSFWYIVWRCSTCGEQLRKMDVWHPSWVTDGPNARVVKTTIEVQGR